jgi:hypothetical protein
MSVFPPFYAYQTRWYNSGADILKQKSKPLNFNDLLSKVVTPTGFKPVTF